MSQALLTTHGNNGREPAGKSVRPLFLGLLAVLSLDAYIVLRIWIGWLGIPYRVEGLELSVLNTVFTWKAGYPPYTYLDHLPASWSPYGPLYQGLCALLPTPSSQPYLTGRLLSLFCLSLAVGAGLVAARRCGSWLPALVVALLSLTARPIFAFGIVYRVDLLGIALSLGGFLLVVHARRSWELWLGILALALAVQAKLILFAGLPAAVLYLCFHDRRRAVIVAIGALGLSALGVALTQWLTHGAYLYDVGLVSTAKARMAKSLDMMTRPVTTSLLWLAAVGFGYSRLPSKERREVQPALFFTGTALLLAGLFGAHDGSSWNYLIEFYVGLLLLTGGVLAALWREARPRPLGWVSVLLAGHGCFALWYTSSTLRKREAAVSAYGEKVRRAGHTVEPLLEQGKHVVALRADPAEEILLRHGRFNDMGFPQERKDPELELLLAAALRNGTVDVVLTKANARTWSAPDQGASAPAADDRETGDGG